MTKTEFQTLLERHADVIGPLLEYEYGPLVEAIQNLFKDLAKVGAGEEVCGFSTWDDVLAE